LTGCFEQRAYTHFSGEGKREGRETQAALNRAFQNGTYRRYARFPAEPNDIHQQGATKMVDRIPEERNPPVDRDPLSVNPAVVNNTGGSGSGGWAVAVILAVLVAVGVFYFASGPATDGVDTNANTSAIETPAETPAVTDTQPTGTQPLEVQPGDGQPASGETAQ
jgi:hypothetical protein